MKEVVTKFMLIVVAVAAVMGFVYGTLWDDTEKIKDATHTQMVEANTFVTQ
ncbi:MAG: hypothetical protein WC834_05395 [Eubacteriales bacterium]